jgi:hypothetical protein
LAVLALPRWRPLLFWQASEAITWVLLMLYFEGGADTGFVHRSLHQRRAAAGRDGAGAGRMGDPGHRQAGRRSGPDGR